MQFKYYDILSSLLAGFIVLTITLLCFDIEYKSEYAIPYLAIAFFLGYLINALSSCLESFYYWTIGGKPSNKIFIKKKGKDYSGISKVKFYDTDEFVFLLKQDLQDKNASHEKMFSRAKFSILGNDNSRISDFNAHFALSRTLLTTILASVIMLIIWQPCNWQVYLMLIPLLICWNRFRERGYYYAREVLYEYLKKNKKRL